MTTKPASTLGFAQAPIVDNKGNPSWNMLQWLIKINTKVDTSLTTLGINPNSPIVGTGKTVGGATQNLTSNGMLPTSSLTGSVGGSQVGFNLDQVPDGAARFAVTNLAGTKGVAQVDAADLAIINLASAHQNKILDNVNDGVTYQRFARVASGQAVISTGLISGGGDSITSVVAAGVLTTDTVLWSPNGPPTNGYAPNTNGSLFIWVYPIANGVDFYVGNPTSGNLTPGTLTINWQVIR